MKLGKFLHTSIHRYAAFYNVNEKKILEFTHQSSSLSQFPGVLLTKTKDALSNEDIYLVDNSDFRILLLNGLVHFFSDIQKEFENLWTVLSADHRVIIVYYSKLWKPVIRIAEAIGLKSKAPRDNWITKEDLDNFCQLTGFQLIKTEKKVMIPVYIPLISTLFNRFIVNLPLLRHLALLNIALIRPVKKRNLQSVSIIVPARNEEGNIEQIVKRIPELSSEEEIIFIEGNSTDDTWNRILEIQQKYTEKEIKAYQQPGKGKADAVRMGFDNAKGDILMILDADMTVPPEDLPKFYKAMVDNHGEYINGSRMVYPMEKKAMRFFNILGNKFFATAFSYLLDQDYRDTLCGTKVLSRENYLQIVRNRSYFGDFDPFGDFDLIFGASKLGLKTTEVPVRYRERTYGTTNISRWKHGFILLRMLLFASRKIKFT